MLPGGSELRGIFEVIELDVGLSYAITDNFWVGAAYRPSYFHADLTEPTPTMTNAAAVTKLSLSKFDPAGGIFGVHYTPERNTNLALVYRTRVTSGLDGTATTPFGNFDATSEYASPDKVTLGVDHHFARRPVPPRRADRADPLRRAPRHDEQHGHHAHAGTTTTPSVADDKTIYEVQVGGEYWAVPKLFALRAGLYFGPGREPPRAPHGHQPQRRLRRRAHRRPRLPPRSLEPRRARRTGRSATARPPPATTGGAPGRYTTGGVIAGGGAVLRF